MVKCEVCSTHQVTTPSRGGFLVFCAPPSRALRSLPLSVMMSGHLYWANGGPGSGGTYGSFWSSTPFSYAASRYLYFYSTNVDPKYGYSKPHGLALRRVAPCQIPQNALKYKNH